MAATPPEVTELIEQLLPILLQWHAEKTVGEIAVLRGGKQWQLEERPKRKHDPVIHGSKAGTIERVGQP